MVDSTKMMKHPLPSPLLPYETFLSIEKIGSLPLHLMALKNLDRTVDEICKLYQPSTPEEEQKLLDLCPYFGVIWPSARALGLYLNERKTQFNKKKGIEIGCGLALPSLVAAKLGAQILATDFHPDVQSWVLKNAELNHLKLAYESLDWTQPPQKYLHHFDFVLASDVLYERKHPDDLAKALASLIHPEGSILLSDPGRVYLDQAVAALENQGFHKIETHFEVEESASLPEIRLEKKRKIHVFEFTHL